MKTVVACMSQTGNTRKVAEAIFGEIQGEKEIKELSELDGLEGYDLSFVGFRSRHMVRPARRRLSWRSTVPARISYSS